MKTGIIVISFGTSITEVRKRCIESIENKIEQAFPDYEVRRGFTSNMIIKKLRTRDKIYIDTPSQAINRMIEDGFERIHVQPLHIIPGFEYEKVCKAVRIAAHQPNINITIGSPLLSAEEHYDNLLNILLDTLEVEKTAFGTVLMGHGSEHHANACYSMLQAKINDQLNNVFIANVEGYPKLDHILERLKAYDHITLIPFMIVAGDHAINDMAGENNSYKSILESEGKSITCYLKGLGELEGVQQIFVERVKEMMFV